MRHRRSRIAALTILVTSMLLASAGGALAANTPAANPYEKVLAQAQALVTVDLVLTMKMDGGGSDREFESTIGCLLIDADGLVLCSNTELGGYISTMSRMMGSGHGLNISSTPSSLKVRLGDETSARPARLLTRDTDRDLAWLGMEHEPSTTFPHLDLEQHAELPVGGTFYQLRRMDTFFGAEPHIASGIIGAIVDKPRRLLVPAEPLNGGYGQPIFDAAGTFVGVTVLQLPAREEARSLFSSPAGLGQSSALQDMTGGLILPAAEIATATALARETIAADEREELE